MLGKLLKYEVKSTGRLFLPAYGALLLFALLNKLFDALGPTSSGILSLPQNIVAILYVLLIMVTGIFTFVCMIQRFYKNLLSDEGYLMFTLPTNTSSLILSKLLVSAMWYIATMVVTVLSIFVIAFDTEVLSSMGDVVRQVFREYGGTAVAYTLEGFLLTLSVVCNGILLVYASIALGHLFQKHRALGAVGAFFLLMVALQVVMSFLGWLLDAAPFLTNWLYDLNLSPAAEVHLVLLATSAFYLIGSAIYFAITNMVLSRKLNLE